MSLPSEFEKDVAIDVKDLGKELMTQASTYLKWSQLWANETSERDRIKNKMEFLRAELSLKIRENPAAFTTGKITEDTVRCLLETDRVIEKVREELLLANQKVNELLAVKTAMEQRKSMLESVARLFQLGYWSDLPAHDVSPMIEKHTDEVINKQLEENPRLKRRLYNGRKKSE